MACRCGWDCNCTNLFGIRPRRACEDLRNQNRGQRVRMEKNKAKGVVLLSGGMDSCVTAAIARERHGAGNVAALHAGYGQRTQKRELRAFTEIADFYGIRERLVVQLDHFRAIGASALTDERIAVPESSLSESDGQKRAAEERRQGAPSSIPVTYVPFRNAHFLSVAAIWAEAVYIGAVGEDSSGYPDCRPEYYRAFQELVRVGTRPETRIEIATPVIAMKKNEIIRRGMELGAPLHLTWSCYQSEDAACGGCGGCLGRWGALPGGGVADARAYRARRRAAG